MPGIAARRPALPTVAALAVVALVAAVLFGAAPAGADQRAKDAPQHNVYGPDAGEFRAASAAGVVRIAGKDRYGTAVAWSQLHWTFENTIAAYIVSGSALPDALTAGGGVDVGNLGPILQVKADHIPADTVAELERLQPCAVVIVGGTSVVSDRVEQQLARYAHEDLCMTE